MTVKLTPPTWAIPVEQISGVLKLTPLWLGYFNQLGTVVKTSGPPPIYTPPIEGNLETGPITLSSVWKDWFFKINQTVPIQQVIIEKNPVTQEYQFSAIWLKWFVAL